MISVPAFTGLSGFGSAALPIAPVLGWTGVQLPAQAVALDSRAPIGLAFSAGLTLTIGA